MLNKVLYTRLKSAFGEVQIVNEDQPLQVETRQGIGREVRWKVNSGEQYRVNCPMCSDERARLYISYAWGMDAVVKFPSSKLVVCHNEHCEGDKERDLRGYLQKKLSSYFSDVRRGTVNVRKPVSSDKAVVQRKLDFPKPEWVIPVNKLGRAQQHVIDYLRDVRKFNLDVLYNTYGVVFAYEYPVFDSGKDYSWLAGRLFIPVTLHGKIIGWQARPPTDDFTGQKYFNCPGWHKSEYVYNIDTARRCSLGLLVEGVTDVWRVGGGAFCTFGKSLSAAQELAVTMNWQAVGVLYDPDTDNDKSKSAMKAIYRLKVKIPKVFRVHLPDDRDPAKCSYKTVWDCVERDAEAAGVKVRRPV